MVFDADTLQDIKTALSYVERIVRAQFEEIPEGKKERIKEILERTDRYFVDGDELMIYSSNPLFEGKPDSATEGIPFDRIRCVDFIGDDAKGFYNAVYLEKAAHLLFPNATRYVSSSATLHFDSFKSALEKKMREEAFDYGTLWFGFSYEGDLYALEFLGESGLDVACASHPIASHSFIPLPLCLANMEPPRIEARYIQSLFIKGEGISELSSFRQGLYDTGVECLLDECVNLKEITVSDDCPFKERILRLAEGRGIEITG